MSGAFDGMCGKPLVTYGNAANRTAKNASAASCAALPAHAADSVIIHAGMTENAKMVYGMQAPWKFGFFLRDGKQVHIRVGAA